jgi:hypothetical protein
LGANSYRGTTMISEIPTGSLTLRAGTFGRTLRATIKGTVRVINISGCPVIGWYSELQGDTIRDQQIDLSITETKPGDPLWGEDKLLKPDPEKIGAFSRDDMHINIYLPPEAFRHFWTAAETDRLTRHIEIEF